MNSEEILENLKSKIRTISNIIDREKIEQSIEKLKVQYDNPLEDMIQVHTEREPEPKEQLISLNDMLTQNSKNLQSKNAQLDMLLKERKSLENEIKRLEDEVSWSDNMENSVVYLLSEIIKIRVLHGDSVVLNGISKLIRKDNKAAGFLKDFCSMIELVTDE